VLTLKHRTASAFLSCPIVLFRWFCLWIQQPEMRGDPVISMTILPTIGCWKTTGSSGNSPCNLLRFKPPVERAARVTPLLVETESKLGTDVWRNFFMPRSVVLFGEGFPPSLLSQSSMFKVRSSRLRSLPGRVAANWRSPLTSTTNYGSGFCLQHFPPLPVSNSQRDCTL